jgi:hypothetical protein
MDEIDDPFEQQEKSRRLPKARANDDAIVTA